ncbi:MAG: hypothetical protein ACPH5S_06345, partial [Candidatus Poseidoniaceae archaeon]
NPIEDVPVVEDTTGLSLAGPLGLLVLGWAFVVGVAGVSIMAILALRRLRPPPAATAWSWDEA